MTLLATPENASSKTRYQEEPRYQEGLYNLGNDVYAWLVPNGSWGESNAGLVVGTGASLLVDTLWDVRYTRTMLKTMQSLTESAPIQTVVNTHADGDHFWGNELVKEADIITSEASLKEMQGTRPKSLLMLGKVGKMLSTARVMGASRVGHWMQAMVAPYHFEEVKHTPAHRSFSGETTLYVGERAIELIEVGPAHTDGDLMVHIPDARVLFTADILFIDSTPVMWAGPVENWLKALDMILGMDVETIVPGHGPVTDKDGVKTVKAYWAYITERLKICYDNGMSAPAAALSVVLHPDYVKQPFADWNSPERIMTNAHTLYRHWENRKRPPGTLELLNIMRQQALLAHELPDAQPAIMRKK